jgi:hypothetical protein
MKNGRNQRKGCQIAGAALTGTQPSAAKTERSLFFDKGRNFILFSEKPKPPALGRLTN